MLQVRAWDETGDTGKGVLGMSASLKMKQWVSFLRWIATLNSLSVNSPMILQCGKAITDLQFATYANLNLGEYVFDLAVL